MLQDGAVLKGAATQRRRLTLLAIIAVAGKKGISRDRLLTLLWPDSGETQGLVDISFTHTYKNGNT